MTDQTPQPDHDLDALGGVPAPGEYTHASDFDDVPSAVSAPAPAAADPAADASTDLAAEVEASLVEEVNAAMAPAVAYGQATGRIGVHTWVEADYEPGGNYAHSAAKLADSAVAPLIVAARGYETIDEESLAEASKRFGLPRKTTGQGKRIAEAVTRGDLLIMPWFTADDISMAAMSLREPKHTTIQFRPARPDVDEKGRERKYEFVSGQKTPIGVHPSFDGTWINQAPVVLLAEGLLKGDSALTGMLLDFGYSVADLAWDGVGGTAAARKRLTTLLNAIPEEKRVVILTIGGVDNWKNNNEWRDIELRDRTAWVGVDGDVATNLNVYRAANQLWDMLKEKKRANPMLLTPTIAAAGGEEKKIGIDDYLAKYGNWSSLVAMLAPSLPPTPPSNDADLVGTYRISTDGTTLEVCEGIPDPFSDGAFIGGRWVPVLGLGGRILSTVAERTPTDAENRTGILGAGANNDDADWDCEIEISWKKDGGSGDDAIERHVISGPANILNYGPDQWDRHKAHIPAPILRNPDWPPPRKVSEDWLRAIKANRADETAVRVRWHSMGWVPVENTVPAFVVGDQVIGADDAPDIDIFAGISEAELAGAGRFGVGEETSGSFEDEDYRAEVRNDIEAMIETFVISGAWTDRKVASTVVAAALRPTLPIRPHTTCFLVGPPSKGKSWTAAMMMGFWSRRPGDFTSASLPGSAKDTAASIELAVARSPIWVVDDLAPASSRQQSETEQNKIGDLIRNVFNGAGKRRSNADMGSRKVHTPRALLVVTAENEPQVASVRDRCVTLNIGWGALAKSSDPTNRVTELCQDSGEPARVTQAMIRHLRSTAKHHPGGWEGLYKIAEGFLRKAQEDAATRMKKRGAKPGDLKRHADLAGDLAVSLLWLRKVAQDVGCRPEILDLLTNEAMIGDVYDLVAMGHKTNKESTPGRALLEALGSALFRKKAHILDAIDASAAPGGPNVAPMLGWEMGAEGTSRPKGDTIGWLVPDDDGELYVFLEQKAAFAIAQREYPNLVPPGQGPRSSWGSVIGEGLHAEHLRRVKSDGTKLNTGRRRPGSVDISGVPIALSVLLAGGDKDVLDRNLDDR